MADREDEETITNDFIFEICMFVHCKCYFNLMQNILILKSRLVRFIRSVRSKNEKK